MWRRPFSGAIKRTLSAIEVATLGSCEFMEVADGQACKKPNKPQTLAFYMYKATRLRRQSRRHTAIICQSRCHTARNARVATLKWWHSQFGLGVSGGPVFQAAGPDYPKIFNQTGSLGAWPSLDESIMRAFSRSPDFSYASAPMFHILHILSLLAFFLAICHRCQGSLGGVMWFGPWIFASENSSWWTALLWQTVCLYTDAWGICTIMSSLNVHDDMVLTDAPSVGSLRRDLSKQTVPRPTTTRPRHVDQNKNVATIQHVFFFTCEACYIYNI